MNTIFTVLLLLVAFYYSDGSHIKVGRAQSTTSYDVFAVKLVTSGKNRWTRRSSLSGRDSQVAERAVTVRSSLSGRDSQVAERAVTETALPAWTSATAGAVGNIFSRTVIAPLERVRVQMIADPSKYSNMVVAMKDIYAKEGLKGLWAGNVLNCLRIGPQMGIAFFAKDYFKTMYAGEGNKPTPLQTLAASMSSGICCQTGIYPLDLIRTRMMTSPGAYTGFGDCISQTISKEGLSALYKGLLPANMFAVPYYGTQFFVYDTLKQQYCTFQRPSDDPRPAHPLLGIPLGAVSSMTACAIAFPFQMAWKRMQVQGVAGRPILYANSLDCLQKVVKTEGVRGVYSGLSANLVKLAPTGAISFLAVEAIKDLMGWRAGQYKA